MKKLVKKRPRLKLQCEMPDCRKTFYTYRYRKYCSPDCAKLANAILGRMRYYKLREWGLKYRGKIK